MKNKEEITRLFLQHQAMLQDYVQALIRDPADADDVFQDLAVLIIHKSPKAPDDQEVFPKWARGVARNVALHFWRKQRNDRLAPDTEMIEACDLAYDEADEERDLWQHRRTVLKHCMNKLTPKHRKIMDLFYGQGMKSREVAAMVQRKEAAVRMMLRRLRLSVADCVEKGSVS